MPRLIELSSRYESRDVDFLADQFQRQRLDRGRRRARPAVTGVTFPVLKDPDNRVADQLLAERTCEALVIDGRGRLRYRGAIDDQYGLGTRRDDPSHHYLDRRDRRGAGRAARSRPK